MTADRTQLELPPSQDALLEVAVAARGQVVVVTGPDGAGKSAVADALATGVLAAGLARFHHRPGVLPARAVHEGPVTEPHAHTPYPRWLSLAKLLYLFCDFWLGWVLRIRPVVRRGGNVIMERGWWDLLVDQRRYRLDVPPSLIRMLGRLLPRPNLTVVLTGPAASLLARKAELPEPELQRQLDAWRDVPAKPLRGVTVDVNQPLPDVVREVEGAIVAPSGSAPSWVGLPTGGRPRWLVPAAPRGASANGLLLHQPMSPSALVVWQGARLYARAGGLALLPRSEAPPAVVDLVLGHVPQDSILALGRSNHPGRWTVFVLRRNGDCSLMAKVAFDGPGKAALAGEANASRTFTRHLPLNLGSPRLVRAADGLLLFEAVCWRPRTRPWRLPAGVAHSLGVWFRAAGGTAERGPAHGDFAPWNLLWDGRRWHVVDWADARDDSEPFADVLHYLVQSAALLGRPTNDELIAGLEGHGWTGAALEAYAAGAQLKLAAARAALPGYLVRSMDAVDRRRPEAAAALRTRQRLLAAIDGGR